MLKTAVFVPRDGERFSDTEKIALFQVVAINQNQNPCRLMQRTSQLKNNQKFPPSLENFIIYFRHTCTVEILQEQLELTIQVDLSDSF